MSYQTPPVATTRPSPARHAGSDNGGKLSFRDGQQDFSLPTLAGEGGVLARQGAGTAELAVAATGVRWQQRSARDRRSELTHRSALEVSPVRQTGLSRPASLEPGYINRPGATGIHHCCGQLCAQPGPLSWLALTAVGTFSCQPVPGCRSWHPGTGPAPTVLRCRRV